MMIQTLLPESVILLCSSRSKSLLTLPVFCPDHICIFILKQNHSYGMYTFEMHDYTCERAQLPFLDKCHFHDSIKCKILAV